MLLTWPTFFPPIKTVQCSASTMIKAPLMLDCPCKSNFDFLIIAIRNKLAGWRANSLSFAGRLVLVTHVLASMPLHISMVLLLSISV